MPIRCRRLPTWACSCMLASASIFDDEAARSERETGFRNAALVNFIKSFGQIDNDVEAVLALYCRQCAIVADCTQLARAFGYLANGGVQPGTGARIVDREQARRVNSVMPTCGTYDAAGEFAFKVGVPCKSGVGGAIVAVVPGEMGAVRLVPGPGRDRQFRGGAARAGAVRHANRAVGVLKPGVRRNGSLHGTRAAQADRTMSVDGSRGL